MLKYAIMRVKFDGMAKGVDSDQTALFDLDLNCLLSIFLPMLQSLFYS